MAVPLKPQTHQTLEFITPAKAEEYLNANTSNRKLKNNQVAKYAADMKAGRWTECLAPIAFYIGGGLADGQHRLFAIIESGVGQWFYILRDFPRPAGLNVDRNIPRSVVDGAHVSGQDPTLSVEVQRLARAIEDGDVAGHYKRARSDAELMDLVTKHRNAAEWALRHGPVGKGVRNAPALASLGRAYYVEADKDRMAHFAKVVSKGFADGSADSAAIALRNYLIARRGEGKQIVSSGTWRDTFLKAQNALRYFMLRRQLMTVRTVSDEAYPLAGATSRPKMAVPKTKMGQRAKAKAERVAARAVQRV